MLDRYTLSNVYFRHLHACIHHLRNICRTWLADNHSTTAKTFSPSSNIVHRLITTHSTKDDYLINSTCGSVKPKPRCIPDSRQIHEPLIKPCNTVHVSAFNVRTLKHTGQQAVTLYRLTVDMFCVSETRMADDTRTELTAPLVSDRFWLRCPSDALANSSWLTGVGIVISARAEATPQEYRWIPINCRPCATRL